MTNTSTQTNSELKFVDEKFEVIPAPAHIRQPGEDAQGPTGPTSGEPGIRTPSVDYTEEDLMFMSETIWSLPQLLAPKKLNVPAEGKVDDFFKSSRGSYV